MLACRGSLAAAGLSLWRCCCWLVAAALLLLAPGLLYDGDGGSQGAGWSIYMGNHRGSPAAHPSGYSGRRQHCCSAGPACAHEHSPADDIWRGWTPCTNFDNYSRPHAPAGDAVQKYPVESASAHALPPLCGTPSTIQRPDIIVLTHHQPSRTLCFVSIRCRCCRSGRITSV